MTETPPPMLPSGDLHWDGETMTVDGQALAPGVYRVGDFGELHLFAPGDDDYEV